MALTWQTRSLSCRIFQIISDIFFLLLIGQSRGMKKKKQWLGFTKYADPMIRIYFLYFLFLLIPFSFRIRFFIFETERELEPVQITFFSEGILIHLGTVCRSEECGSLVFRWQETHSSGNISVLPDTGKEIFLLRIEQDKTKFSFLYIFFPSSKSNTHNEIRIKICCGFIFSRCYRSSILDRFQRSVHAVVGNPVRRPPSSHRSSVCQPRLPPLPSPSTPFPFPLPHRPPAQRVQAAWCWSARSSRGIINFWCVIYLEVRLTHDILVIRISCVKIQIVCVVFHWFVVVYFQFVLAWC